MIEGHQMALQVRFGDTDALGHVNNASFAQYAEAGRLDFLRLFEIDVSSIILANLTIDFRNQVRFGDQLHIETRVSHIGRTSIGLHQTVIASGAVAAEVRTVVVLFDYRNRRPVEIPEPMREQLTRYYIPSH